MLFIEMFNFSQISTNALPLLLIVTTVEHAKEMVSTYIAAFVLPVGQGLDVTWASICF